MPPVPRKLKLGRTKKRVAIILPTAFTQKPRTGAKTNVQTPHPHNAPVSETTAVTIADRLLTNAGALKFRLRPMSTSGHAMKGGSEERHVGSESISTRRNGG